MRMLLDAMTDLIKSEKTSVSLLCPTCLEFVPLDRWYLDMTEDLKARPVFTGETFKYIEEAKTPGTFRLWHTRGICSCVATEDREVIYSLEDYFVYMVKKSNGPAPEISLVIGKKAGKLYKNAERLFIELRKYARKYGMFSDVTEVL